MEDIFSSSRLLGVDGVVHQVLLVVVVEDKLLEQLVGLVRFMHFGHGNGEKMMIKMMDAR